MIKELYEFSPVYYDSSEILQSLIYTLKLLTNSVSQKQQTTTNTQHNKQARKKEKVKNKQDYDKWE